MHCEVPTGVTTAIERSAQASKAGLDAAAMVKAKGATLKPPADAKPAEKKD